MWDASELYALASDMGAAGTDVAAKADQAVRKTAADGVTVIQNDPATPVATGHHKGTMGWGSLAPGVADFGATTNYAFYLEFGTRFNGGPRPHIFPAADKVRPFLEQALAILATEF